MFYAARPWLTKHALRGGFLAHARRFFESKNRRCAPTKHALRGGFLAKTSHTLGHLNLAIQHFLISAKMGHEASMINIKELFAQGFATENALIEALEGYKASTEEMYSISRELAKIMGAKKITKV